MEIGGYTVVRELGRGGMGVVYEALDPRTQQHVALKTVGTQVPRRGLERLQREAQALTRLSHPGLVPCLGSGVGPYGFFLTMGLVEGTTLGDLLQRSGPLPLGHALQIMGDVGEALAYVHAQGLLHRDVKPSNVLLSTSGRVVLTDFGLVKLSPELQEASQGSLTSSGAMLGTPGYWPPEQALGRREQISAASDVYGWAATLYALLGGQPPRSGKTYLELLGAFELPIASLRPARPEVPVWLDALLARCLARDPAQRPSLAEALDALRGFGHDAGRQRAGYALAAGLAGVALLGAVVWVALLVSGGESFAETVARFEEKPEAALPEAPAATESLALREDGEPEAAYEHARAWLEREPTSQAASEALTRACVLTKRWSEGLQCAAAALARDPQQPPLWALRSQCLLEFERYGEALNAAERAYGLDPRHPEALLAYGHALMFNAQFARGEQVYGELLAIEPAAAAYAWRAQVRHFQGDVQGAEQDLAVGLAQDPAAGELYLVRGLIKLRLHDDPSGADDLLRALELGLTDDEQTVLTALREYFLPKLQAKTLLALLERDLADSPSPHVRATRAEALLDLGYPAEALELAEALVALAPRPAALEVPSAQQAAVRYAFLKGRALTKLGRVEEGLDILEPIVDALSPVDHRAAYRDAVRSAAQIALSYRDPGYTRGARAVERWLEVEPDSVEALTARLTLWGRQRRDEDVLEESLRLIPLAGQAGDTESLHRIYSARATALGMLGRPAEAVAEFSLSLQLLTAPRTLAARSHQLLALGEAELAERDLLAALELDPRLATAWLFLAWIWADSGRMQHAAFAAEQILARDPPAEPPVVAQARQLLEEAGR